MAWKAFVNPLKSTVSRLQALRKFKPYDAPPEVLAYAANAYARCCDWFGLSDDAGWPFMLYRGTSNACRRLPNVPGYVISLSDSTLDSGDLGCKEAIAAQPDMVAPHWTLAFVYQDLKMTDELLETMPRLVAIQPRNPLIRWNLGHAYAAVGDIENSMSEYAVACSLEPGRAEYERSFANAIAKLDGK